MTLFSLQELDIADDPYILLIKNRIMEKVNGLMGELEQAIHELLHSEEHHLPPEINLKHGKISKGENYKYLPYVMLDYPAFFTKKDIFAFRTMFYWGHFLSFTLHLQGKYCNLYSEKLLSCFSSNPNLYFNINTTPWEYTYEAKNYVLITQLADSEMMAHLQENNFIKLSIQIPIAELGEAEAALKPFLKRLINAID